MLVSENPTTFQRAMAMGNGRYATELNNVFDHNQTTSSDGNASRRRALQFKLPSTAAVTALLAEP